MDTNPIQTAARHAQAKRRLGPDAVCVQCGMANLSALTPTPKSLLEAHHVVGRAHEPALTVPLCRNCHAILTEQLRRVGASMRPAATVLDRLVAMLRALGAFFQQLGSHVAQWAETLAALLPALTAAYPSWRTLPEAQ